jgi:hypothetical protein
MMQRIARIAAPAAAVLDLVGAFTGIGYDRPVIPIAWAAVVTGAALVPCAFAFAGTMIWQMRRSVRTTRGALVSMRLPITLPRAYLGAAVLGFMGTLAAMGERFGPYIFLAGIALIALALSQAAPRRPGMR